MTQPAPSTSAYTVHQILSAAFGSPNEDDAQVGSTITTFTELLHNTVHANPATAAMPLYRPIIPKCGFIQDSRKSELPWSIMAICMTTSRPSIRKPARGAERSTIAVDTAASNLTHAWQRWSPSASRSFLRRRAIRAVRDCLMQSSDGTRVEDTFQQP